MDPTWIVVAVDSETDADRIRNHLETRGYSVDTASDADHAIALAGTHLYRALLVDADMLLVGAEAVGRLGRVRGPQLKVIAVAANLSLSTRATLNEIGVDAILAKPIDLHALQQKLTRLLGKPAGK